jgi:hypothetical protein
MNDLVDNVNAKIQAVCKTNPRCVFIDAAARIDKLTGHYCEDGVDETYTWAHGGLGANRYEKYGFISPAYQALS